MSATPLNAVALVRLSDLRPEDLDTDGDSESLADQEKRIRDYAGRIGWTIRDVIVENDEVQRQGRNRNASAYKRKRVRLPDGRTELRTVRPGFRRALDLLSTGARDGLITLDLDRTCRDPRDLEDLIDVVESRTPRLPVESVTGSLRLATDADVTMARVMVAVANKSSRDTARRVSAARERTARAGRHNGGVRRFGFQPDGNTIIGAEAEIIRDLTRRFLAGVSLRSMAAELRASGTPTATGARWATQTVRDLISRPRNAGISVHKGVEVGPAVWEPIVPVEVLRAVQRKLADGDHPPTPGNTPRWLGSGLYLCGRCETPTTMTSGKAGGNRVYKCSRHDHLGRVAMPVDEYVGEYVVEVLSRPDAADLFTPASSTVDVSALRDEESAIRRNLKGLAADRALGLIDREQMVEATRVGRARLEVIRADLVTAVADSPLTPFVGVDDIQAAWDGLPLANKRLIVDTLLTVTILVAGKRGPGFDRSTVRIERKRKVSHHV